ncbi:hypothetical protein BD779DRAFT_1023969 [Infundibulicybe gibba]|nr:hypothetical protein BD779DRAFT_1023969 [Infundibulicybe gibba]
MALSVSGFPESHRQLSGNEADSLSASDNNKALSRPILRGLFGKRSDTKPLGSSNDADFKTSSPPNSPPRSPPPASHTAQEDYQPPLSPSDFSSGLVHRPEPQLPIYRPKPQLPSPRAMASLRHIQPSPTRLEIGNCSKPLGAPALHTLPKPPTVVVQEWSAKPAPTLHLPRPQENNSVAGPSTHASTQNSPPASRVLLSPPSRPRAHTEGPSAVSVRYLPLVVQPAGKDTPTPLTPQLSAPIARKPYSRQAPYSFHPSTAAITPNRHLIHPSKIKRPRSSPGYSASSARSPLEVIPSSWASRPVDLHTRPPHSPPAVISHIAPRARSHSRTRRTPSKSSSSPRVSSPRIPLDVSKPSVMHPAGPRRLAPLSPRVTLPSPFPAPHRPPRSLPSPPHDAPKSPLAELASPTESDIISLDLTAPLHSHPMGSFSDEDGDNAPPASPVAFDHHGDNEDEGFIDDPFQTTRSLSPITYARRASLGTLADDYPSSSRSSSPVRYAYPVYQTDYRDSPSRSPSPISYARRSSIDAFEDVTSPPRPKRRTQPRSYLIDHSSGGSSPHTLDGSPERSGTRQPAEASRGARLRRGRSTRRGEVSTPEGSVMEITLPSPRTIPPDTDSQVSRVPMLLLPQLLMS